MTPGYYFAWLTCWLLFSPLLAGAFYRRAHIFASASGAGLASSLDLVFVLDEGGIVKGLLAGIQGGGLLGRKLNPMAGLGEQDIG